VAIDAAQADNRRRSRHYVSLCCIAKTFWFAFGIAKGDKEFKVLVNLLARCVVLDVLIRYFLCRLRNYFHQHRYFEDAANE
jgi:hypothetical protein